MVCQNLASLFLEPRGILSVLLALVASSTLAGCGTATKPDATPPSAVTDLAVASVGDSSVTLTWTAPGDDGNRGRATAYDFRYAQFSVITYWEIALRVQAPVPGPAGTMDSVVVSGLDEDTAYNFAIRAVDEAGNESDLSNMASGVPADYVAPAAITDLAATVLDHRRIELRWTAPGDDGDRGLVEGYDIRYSAETLGEASWATYPRAPFTQMPVFAGQGEVDTVVVPDPSTTYTLAVRAYDEKGNTAGISNVVMATTPADTTPPGAVTDLSVRLETAVSVVLSWTAPGDDGSVGQATSYDARYSPSPITETTWAGATTVDAPAPFTAGTAQELVIWPLASGTRYYFALKTTDEAGNTSGLSNVAEQQTAQIRVWHIVPDGTGDAPTVQAGIDSAADGDTVLVEPGTYYENVNLRGKEIHLKGDAGPEVTILDGTYGDSSVVVCNSGETNRTVIEGLTIAHGKGTILSGNGKNGAGVLCLNAAPIIRSNIIRSNRAETPPGGNMSWGGGIAAYSITATLIIEDNVIEDNFATTNGGGLVPGASIIRYNIISGNATRDGDGGGINLRNAESTIQGNLFFQNTAGDHGGAILVANTHDIPSSQIDIFGNVFVANQAMGVEGMSDCSGGAISVLGGALIHENTLAFNDAESATFPAGGGICLLQPHDVTIERNILVGNQAVGIVATQFTEGQWHATIVRNLFHENGDQDVYNRFPIFITLDVNDNLFEDPLLCIPTSDTRGEVAGASPALNQPYGVIGAVPEPGCAPYTSSTTRGSVWGTLRGRFGLGGSPKPGRGGQN